MASEHTVTKVLLEWVNSFSLGKTLRATDELTDGVILWEVLQDIDPQYFLDELPERNLNDHWVAKWQNLKHIHKLLISYIRHQNDDELPSDTRRQVEMNCHRFFILFCLVVREHAALPISPQLCCFQSNTSRRLNL